MWGAAVPSAAMRMGMRRAWGRKSARKQVRSLLAGPVTASSMAVMSWSSVVVEGQAGPAAVIWDSGDWARSAEDNRAAVRARKRSGRRMVGIVQAGIRGELAVRL